MNFNQITLAGNVANDVEMRYTATGKAVTSFDVAINEGNGDTKKTMYVRVTCWEKLAETVSTYLTKGQGVLVSGKLMPSRAYVRKDGEMAASQEVTAFGVQFGPKPKGWQGDNGAETPHAAPAGKAAATPSDDEDTPF